MSTHERRAVLATVAGRIPSRPRPVLVGVDGVDGAGKSTFADELADVVRGSDPEVCVVRASVDGFHHPRRRRHARGRSAETFWSDSFDYEAFRRELLDPWRAGPGAAYRPAVHDLASDRALDLAASVVPDRGILVVDGIFLQRSELRDVWDLVVFLEVPFEVSVPRMAARDGTPEHPEHPEQSRYVDAQRRYRRSCDPRGRADVVVDNTDLEHPLLR